MVVRMRGTRSHRNNRRSHFALAPARLSVCESCKAMRLSHGACLSCGKYRGRVVIDMQARLDRQVKRAKAKEKAGAK